MQPAKEPAMEPAHAEAQHLVYQPDFDSDIDGGEWVPPLTLPDTPTVIDLHDHHDNACCIVWGLQAGNLS